MRSTFFGLQIGQAGLTTSQFGLDVTSHNIANAETEGFTRQRVVQTALLPSTGFGRALPAQTGLRVGVGTGVKIHDQIRSEFLDRRFRTENSVASYWSVRTQELRYLESFFDSVNEETSINYSIQSFFEAVKVLSADVVEGAPRTLLRDAGMDMVQQFNLIYTGLVDLQAAQNLAVEVKTGEINRIAAEIVELNKAIYLFEITGQIANDLRDARNLLVDELSTIIDVDYRNTSDMHGNPIFEVSIAGKTLVSHDKHAMLGVFETPNIIPGEASVLSPVWVRELDGSFAGTAIAPSASAITNFTEVRVMNHPSVWVPNTHAPDLQHLNLAMVKGGEIKAYVSMRDGTGMSGDVKGIPYYIEMMNNLARAIVQEVNAVHSKGWSDHPLGSRTGINFFHIGIFENAATGERITLNSDNQWVDSSGMIYGGIDLHDNATFPAGFTLNTHISQITAKNMRLSIEVLESAANIAASTEEIVRGHVGGTQDGLQRGNNENMRAIYELFSLKRDITVVDGRGNTIVINSFDGYATSIRHDVGSTTSLALNAARNGNTLITAMSNQRKSVAGVSLDEEMVSLIRYQHAYSGAARVITAMDDALDRLINGTGRVGL